MLLSSSSFLFDCMNIDRETDASALNIFNYLTAKNKLATACIFQN